MLKRHLRSTKSAFTLIEIAFALLIIGVGLVGILSLFPVGFEAASRACALTRATFLAQSVMEDMKKEGYDGLAQIQSCTVEPYKIGGYDNYEFTVTIVDIGGLDLKQVDVKVSWPAGAANQADITLSTYVAKY